METNDLIPSLALFTLLAVVALAVVGLLLFKRKAANRHPMEKSKTDTIATVRENDVQDRPATVPSTDALLAAERRQATGSDADRVP